MTDEFTWIEKKVQDTKKHEIAICFARMWGVLETLDELPNVGFKRMRNMVIVLAEEFIAGEEEDPVDFFVQGLKEIKKIFNILTILKILSIL